MSDLRGENDCPNRNTPGRGGALNVGHPVAAAWTVRGATAILIDIDKFNPHHDEKGQFSDADGAKTYSDLKGSIKGGPVGRRSMDEHRALYGKPGEKQAPAKGTLKDLDVSPKNAADLKAQAIQMSKLLDPNGINLKESAAETKSRIASEIAARLQGNDDWQAAKEKLGYTSDHPDGEIVNDFIHNWAMTSGDHNPMGVAMQIAATNEFGIDAKDSLGHVDGEIMDAAHSEYDDIQPGMQAFLRAQYDNTQDWFKGQGITEVPVMRGMCWQQGEAPIPSKEFDGESRTMDVSLQAMSSFSSNPSVARDFSGGEFNRMVVGATVPVERIIGTCQSGYRCRDEQELVVLGGTAKVWAFPYDGRSMSFVPGSAWDHMSEASKGGN